MERHSAHPLGIALKENELIESIYKGVFNLTPTLPSPLKGTPGGNYFKGHLCTSI